MKMKHIFIFLFILLLPMAYADWSQTYDFQYTSSFESGGWQHLQGVGACTPDNPINNTDFTLSYGINNTNTCGAYTRQIRRNFAPTNNISSSREDGVIITFDALEIQDTTANNHRFLMDFLDVNTSGASDTYFRIISGDLGRNYTSFYTWGGSFSQNCSFPVEFGVEHNYELQIDFDTMRYTFLMDGLTQCNQLGLGSNDFESHGIILAQLRDVGETNQIYYDNLVINVTGIDAQTTAEECAYPVIYCDNFDYSTPLMARPRPYDWVVYSGLVTADTSFSPVDNELNLESNADKQPFHDIESFPLNVITDTEYTIEDADRFPLTPCIHSSPVPHAGFCRFEGYTFELNTIVTRGVFASQFSSQFNLNVSAGCFRYTSKEWRYDYEVYDIRACRESTNNNLSWSIKNSAGTYIDLCANCSLADHINDVKIITSFSQREQMPFNSTFVNDSVQIVVNNVSLGTFDGFVDHRAGNTNKHRIIKDETANFTIDNYYVMVGTDRFYDTTPITQFNPLFPRNETTDGTGFEVEDDVAENIFSMYDTLGLRSWTSRIIASLFMILIFTGAGVYFAMINNVLNGATFGSIVVFDIILAIIFVYINLLPVWIPLFFGLLVVGFVGFAIALKLNSS